MTRTIRLRPERAQSVVDVELSTEKYQFFQNSSLSFYSFHED